MFYGYRKPCDSEVASEQRTKPDDVAIAANRVARWKEQNPAAEPAFGRFFMVCGGNVLITIVVGATMFGIANVAPSGIRLANKDDPAEGPDMTAIVRSEVLRLWLPGTLTEMARDRSQPGFPRTHEDLRRYLELQHQQGLWYALTMRAHHADGRFSDVTVIRKPYDDRLVFPELLVVLATAAGNAPESTVSDFTKASIHLIADESVNREPRARSSPN